MTLLHWITSDWTHLWTTFHIAVSAIVFLWGACTASYERQTGHKMATSNLTIFMGFLLDLSKNIPGLANRALERAGKTPLFLPKDPQ